ncbi:MAG: transporter substrate-binding protein [Paenibacillaceae bacterium]|nr:transporter substrate-binding protein [Paenibacillaceae bacterium]
MLLVSACGNGGKEQDPSAGKASNPSQAPSSGAAADPAGKYEPPITISTVRTINAPKYDQGDSIDSNVWTRLFQSQLGIKVQTNWVVSPAEFEQKMNVTIASNDLPDLIPLTASQLNQLVEGGKVSDLTEVYEKYASAQTKGIIMQDGGVALKASTFNGKLMAIPHTTSSIDSAPLLWIRTDWLKKLNLSEPKSMDDVLRISEAFVQNDPDGNGKADTQGILVAGKDLWGGFPGLTGFMNGYNGYPGIWIKDSSGKIVYGSVQPEVKKALAQLQAMYKSGQIDKEFGVKDSVKVKETVAGGKGGIFFGAMWTPGAGLQDNKINDPSAEWQAFAVPAADGGKPQVIYPVTTYYAINKDAKNPEAAMKILNLFIEKIWGQSADYYTYAKSKENISYSQYPPIQAWPARKNLNTHINVTEAVKTKNPSKLNPEERTTYDAILAFQGGDVKSWNQDAIFGEKGAFSVIKSYEEANHLTKNEFNYAPTPTMVKKMATLIKMQDEVFTKIIMGDSIDSFDKFVTDWGNLGGNDITKEVNEYINSRK